MKSASSCHHLFPIESLPFYPFYFPRPFWPLTCQCTWPTEPQTSVNPSIQLLSLLLLKKFTQDCFPIKVSNFIWAFIPAHQSLSVLEVMPLFISPALNSTSSLLPQISFPIIFFSAKDLPIPLGKLRPLGKNSLNFFPNHLQIKPSLDLFLSPSLLPQGKWFLPPPGLESLSLLRNLFTDLQLSPLYLQPLLHSWCFSLSTCSSQILPILLSYNSSPFHSQDIWKSHLQVLLLIISLKTTAAMLLSPPLQWNSVPWGHWWLPECQIQRTIAFPYLM